ncbi:MAG: 1-deoxy1-beta-hydroxypentalenate dehydrogenase [Planctomycetota bacterium]
MTRDPFPVKFSPSRSQSRAPPSQHVVHPLNEQLTAETEFGMDMAGRVIVVTGAARGIGAALCRRMVTGGAARVVVSDRDELAAHQLAESLGPTALACGCDVGSEEQLQRLVDMVLADSGRIDVFCSNAGITVSGGIETATGDWQRMWDVNVMSRVHAARLVVPHMLKQGSGYLVHTASAAGLLTEIGSASYSVTKHADVALAEWLSTCYGRSGIRVSCVCPLGVETDMLNAADPIHRFLQLQSISADEAAGAIIEGLKSEKFLILPHPQVLEFFQLKGEDYDRWLRGMQRLRQKLTRDTEKQAA